MLYAKTSLWKPCQPRLHWWMEGCKSKCHGKKLGHRKEAIMTLPWRECTRRRNRLRREIALRSWMEKFRSWWNKALLSKCRMRMLITVNQNGTCHSKPCLLQKRALKSDWCLTPPPKDTMVSPWMTIWRKVRITSTVCLMSWQHGAGMNMRTLGISVRCLTKC